MLTRLLAYVKGLVRRDEIDAEVSEELRFHLEMETQANIERGMPRAEARRAALRDLGGVTQTREAVHDVRATLLDSVWQDVKFALRAFRRNPGFTFVALFVLALGIAANTTIFSLVNAALFRPLPVPRSSDLRFVGVRFARFPNFEPSGVPYATFEQLAARREVFAGVAGYQADQARIGTGLAAAIVPGEKVTAGYFDVLRVKAALGRTFNLADNAPGAVPVVIVSDQFWRKHLNADPKAVGKTIDFRAVPVTQLYATYHLAYTVIGVMPPAFTGLSSAWMPAEYWVPLRTRMEDVRQGNMAQGMYGGTVEKLLEVGAILLVARLGPGVTEGAAGAALAVANHDMPATRWATPRGLEEIKGNLLCQAVKGGRLPFDPRGSVVPSRLALVLMIVSGMVLLIAASNLAGVLVARGVARRGEVGVRLALGAGRTRVARQMLTESLLLSLVGTVAAVGLARAFIALFLAYMPSEIGYGPSMLMSISLQVPIDVPVLLFTAGLGIVAGLLVGFTPALQALRTNVLDALAGGVGALTATPRSRIRKWIVVPQICLSLVLLLAAAVLVRALVQAELADRGFDADRVTFADFALPSRYSRDQTEAQWQAENARRKTEYLQLLEDIRALPGIEHAALASKTAWTGYYQADTGISVVTRQGYSAGQNRWVSAADVSADYFETMGIPILRGRTFDRRDSATSPPVAVVCEQTARLLWPDKDALGQYIAKFNPRGGGKEPPRWMQVIGIAREIKVAGMEDRNTPFLYTPIEQQPRIPSSSVVIRGAGAAGPELMKTVWAAVVAAHPEADMTRARTLREEVAQILYPRRLGAAILTVSGVFGLLLSMVGLYGVVSYSAARRMREVGIRTALGAGRRDILALLLREALVALLVGMGCGVAMGYAAMRIVSSKVVAIPALDLVTVAEVSALLSAVILAACLLPARRAARANPIDVLRAQ